MKKCVLILILAALQISCTTFPTSRFDARVQKSCGDSHSCFETIQAAIDAAPATVIKPYRIYIADGDYQEKIQITKSNLALMGQSAAKTRIFFGDYAGKETAPGKSLSTPGSATFRISAANIQLQNITVENTFDFLRNDALASDNPVKLNGSQAIALFIDAPSDRVLVRNVTILSFQDTLFVNSGRAWFDKVLVAGNVDFIFGNGNALFTDSEIKTLGRGKPVNPHGFITAPSTLLSSTYGLTFLNCRLTRDKSVPDNSVPLGRPWHPTTQFSDGRYADPNAIGKAVFMNTWMDAHISQNGWYSMGGRTKEGGRKSFLPEDSRFFEFMTKGPGAIHNEKRRQLDSLDAKQFTRDQILGDWHLAN
jgi:pectinesterase